MNIYYFTNIVSVILLSVDASLAASRGMQIIHSTIKNLMNFGIALLFLLNHFSIIRDDIL